VCCRFEKGRWCIGLKFEVIGTSPFIVFIMICALEIAGSDDLSVPVCYYSGGLFLSDTILIVGSTRSHSGKGSITQGIETRLT
jgi:hypothetical protein